MGLVDSNPLKSSYYTADIAEALSLSTPPPSLRAPTFHPPLSSALGLARVPSNVAALLERSWFRINVEACPPSPVGFEMGQNPKSISCGSLVEELKLSNNRQSFFLTISTPPGGQQLSESNKTTDFFIYLGFFCVASGYAVCACLRAHFSSGVFRGRPRLFFVHWL